MGVISLDQLEDKIKNAILENECEAILAVGVDNFQYLTQMVLPFAEYFPDRKAVALIHKENVSTVIVPLDWESALMDQGWKGDIIAYDENDGIKTLAMVKSLSEAIKGKGLDKNKIGIDINRATKNLMNQLETALPLVNWIPTDTMFRDLRILKTNYEVDCIEKASKHADNGIVWALMHLEGTVDTLKYTVAEFTERIRVHANENGASGVGLLSTSLGSDCQIYYTPQRGWFKNGEIFRMDVSSHHNCYWTNVGRMGVTGKPSDEQATAYMENRKLKEEVLNYLKPGIKCNEVYAHAVREAENMSISFWKEVGIGHGVGASHHEPPYLNLSDSTELTQGMVLALDIYSYGPRKELIHDKDVYVITEEGNEKLSWYRDWDRLYEVTGFRATH
jgi:Xaa-Pro aminopeptidase/Xaa-Pro dipeptidase